MVTIEQFRTLALSLPGTLEQPHFEKTSFRVKKKIFATLDEDAAIAALKLSQSDQSYFCSVSKQAIYPVPNKWGAQGWTFVELRKVSQQVILDALISFSK